MNPVDFPGSNGVLTAPADLPDCVPLPVLRQGGVVMSVWRLEPKELAELIVTRRIVLHVWSGESSPPVWLSVYDAVGPGGTGLDTNGVGGEPTPG